MENKIMDLIIHYSIQNKEFDEDFVRELVGIVKKERELEGYIDATEIIEEKAPKIVDEAGVIPEERKDEHNLAGYHPFTRDIKVYINDLLQYVREMVSIFKISFPEVQDSYLINIFATQMLLHELEHAYQAKKIQERKSDESILLKASHPNITIFNEYIKKGYSVEEVRALLRNTIDTYNALYHIELGERLANIDSYRTIYSMLGRTKELTPDFYSFIRFTTYSKLLDGYDEKNGILSPTVTFLEAKKEFSALKSLSWYSENFDESVFLLQKKYKLVDRLRLGLPVSVEELHYAREQISKLTLHR